LAGLADRLLARLHGVGAADIDVDAADRVGVAADDLRTHRERRQRHQHDAEDRGKNAG